MRFKFLIIICSQYLDTCFELVNGAPREIHCSEKIVTYIAKCAYTHTNFALVSRSPAACTEGNKYFSNAKRCGRTSWPGWLTMCSARTQHCCSTFCLLYRSSLYAGWCNVYELFFFYFFSLNNLNLNLQYFFFNNFVRDKKHAGVLRTQCVSSICYIKTARLHHLMCIPIGITKPTEVYVYVCVCLKHTFPVYQHHHHRDTTRYGSP